MIFKSIQWRLQAWHGLLLVVVLGAFGVTAFQFQRVNLFRHIDQELQMRRGLLLGELRNQDRPGRPPPPDRRRGDVPAGEPDAGGGTPEFPPPPRDFVLSQNVSALFEGGSTNAFYFVLWRRDGVVLKSSADAGETVPIPERLVAADAIRLRGNWRDSYHFTPPGECVLVGRWIAPDLAELRRFAWRLTGAGAAVLLIGLAGGWWMATRAIRPLEQISATANRISAGNLSERINVAETENELGRLAGVLNSTFARLDAAFARQQQFTADASHELRTPISVILNQTQSALARDRSAADYRETLEACQRAAQRMRKLTESLLALARIDARGETAQPSDLASIARDCIDLIQPLAAERRHAIRAELAPAPWHGNPERMAQVVTNLLTNALQHSPESGEVRVSTRQDNGSAVLTISDQGPGVPADELGKIFERFYRSEQSRNRLTGGVGLGLAIVKSCVESETGSVAATNVEPHGLQLEVRLPSAP